MYSWMDVMCAVLRNLYEEAQLITERPWDRSASCELVKYERGQLHNTACTKRTCHGVCMVPTDRVY